MKVANFFGELKRRNVYKVAVAYAVVGWLLVQIATQVFPFFEVPNWGIRLVVLIIAIGFPIALIVAWAFELTPEGLKRTEAVESEAAKSRTWIYVVVIAGLLSISLFFLGRYTALRSAGESPRVSTGSLPTKSIAVLPFVNMSSDKENEYFVDGLTEEILNRLSQISDLKVPGRTSSFVFKNQNRDLRQIGAVLGVANVLEGSVRKSEGRLRITAQLSRTADGYHLWSQAYDRKLDDVFAIQEEIARAIADALSVQLKVVGAQSEQPTRDMTAYNNYLEARGLIVKRTPNNLGRAVTLLQNATKQDASFAKAWGALAQAHALAPYYRLAPTKESLDAAERAARHALAIDDSLASAHSALADVLRDRFEWLAAEAEYLRAIELNPGEPETHNQYAQMLVKVGHTTTALEHADRACELDPLAWVPPTVASVIHLSRGELAQSKEFIDRSAQIRGELVGFQLRVQLLYALSIRDVELARRILAAVGLSSESEWSPDKKLIKAMDDALASVSSGSEPPDLSQALREAWSLGKPDAGLSLAAVAVFVKHPDAALDALWFDFRSPIVIDSAVIWTPVFKPLRNEQRFIELLKAMRLPEYWRKAGWGDFCRPKGADDFECVAP